LTLNRENWNKNSYIDLLKYIEDLQEAEYRDFNKKLIPGEEHILGIRMPVLRKISKEIIEGNWREYLRVCEDTYHIYSENSWQVRFAIVMLLEYYIDEAYLKDIFSFCNDINSEAYYVQMAIAWLISMCYVKFEGETLDYLNNNNLDNFTYNKALQKIVESYRVDNEKKKIIRSMKRKTRN